VSTALRELLPRLRQQGWRIEKHKHIKMYSPDGRHLIVCGCTESDHRALRNTMSRLRRAGFHE